MYEFLSDLQTHCRRCSASGKSPGYLLKPHPSNMGGVDPSTTCRIYRCSGGGLFLSLTSCCSSSSVKTCVKVFGCNKIPSCVPWTLRGPRTSLSLCWWSRPWSPRENSHHAPLYTVYFSLSEKKKKRAFCPGGCKGSRSHMHVAIET